VANELGAGDAPAAKQAVITVVGLSAAQALVVSSILLLLRHRWGWLFSGDAEVVETVAGIMPFIDCVAILDGIQGVLSGRLHYSIYSQFHKQNPIQEITSSHLLILSLGDFLYWISLVMESCHLHSKLDAS